MATLVKLLDGLRGMFGLDRPKTGRHVPIKPHGLGGDA